MAPYLQRAARAFPFESNDSNIGKSKALHIIQMGDGMGMWVWWGRGELGRPLQVNVKNNDSRLMYCYVNSENFMTVSKFLTVFKHFKTISKHIVNSTKHSTSKRFEAQHACTTTHL